MSLNEDVIREALLRSQPEELDDVLTTVEAYRMCIGAARKLRRFRALHNHRRQLLECAQACESVLADFTATGSLRSLRFPESLGDAPDVIFFCHKW